MVVLNWEKYNKVLLLLVISIIFFVSFLNIFVDPFDVFHTKNYFNRVRPNIDKNQRISLIPGLKFDKREINSIWIGSSKTGWNSNEKYESVLLGFNIKNLALKHCSIKESIDMAKNAILIHPEIKTIYWGLDFSEFKKIDSQKVDSIKLISNKDITKEELLPLIISFDTFGDTFKTIQKNLKKKVKVISYKDYGNRKEYNSKILNKYKDTVKNYYRDYYSDYQLSNDIFEEIEDFIDYAKNKGVKVVIFATTMHITERILIDNTNNSDNFNEFKRKLVKIQPYYDFAVVDKYTTEEIKPDMKYFRDAIHAYAFIRKKITNQLFLNNEDFGVWVSEKNIEEHLKNEDIKFKNHLRKNGDLVEQTKEWCK